jgi:hypothetical protein
MKENRNPRTSESLADYFAGLISICLAKSLFCSCRRMARRSKLSAAGSCSPLAGWMLLAKAHTDG